MKIIINGKSFISKLYENETTKKLVQMLPMTVTMSELSNEKYYYLPSSLPTSAKNPGKIQAGDIMLFGSNCLVLFYQTHLASYIYTKVGRIENVAGLAMAVGSGNIVVTFSKV